MAFNISKTPVYAKGTMSVWFYNPATGDLDYFNNKVQQNQLTTNVNMAAVNGGVGNPVLINLPDTSEVSLNITAADMSLEARQLSVGGILGYNGVIPAMDAITATSAVLTLPQIPAAGYGMPAPVCFIDNAGTAYTVDAETREVQGFVATPGTTYCVRYFTRAASAQYLRISSVFSPSVEVVMIQIPAYSAQGTAFNQGSHVGDFYIWIPRMQFSGNAETDGSQTQAATTNLSGTALSYDEALATGACTAEEQYGALAYMVYMPLAGATSAVEGLVIVGGEVEVAAGGSVQLPVKYVINDMLVQPDFADLTYQSSATGTATVSDAGVIAGVAAGSCEITATLDGVGSVVCNCNVTSA